MNLRNSNFLKAILFFSFSSILPGSISIDGKLTEPEWQQAEVIDDFVTVYPNDKSKPKFKTEVRIFSDDKGIYFGFTNEQSIDCLLYTSPSPRDT